MCLWGGRRYPSAPSHAFEVFEQLHIALDFADQFRRTMAALDSIRHSIGFFCVRHHSHFSLTMKAGISFPTSFARSHSSQVMLFAPPFG